MLNCIAENKKERFVRGACIHFRSSLLQGAYWFERHFQTLEVVFPHVQVSYNHDKLCLSQT